jgi:hypothetical protein
MSVKISRTLGWCHLGSEIKVAMFSKLYFKNKMKKPNPWGKKIPISKTACAIRKKNKNEENL